MFLAITQLYLLSLLKFELLLVLSLVVSVHSDSEVKTVATIRSKGMVGVIKVDAFELDTE